MEFGKSDPLARAHLLQAAFALLQCCNDRGLEVQPSKAL